MKKLHKAELLKMANLFLILLDFLIYLSAAYLSFPKKVMWGGLLLIFQFLLFSPKRKE